jgi:hypothetical protein
MNKVFNIILSIVFFLLGIFFMQQCGDSFIEKNEGNICFKDSTITHDSTVVYIDTIPFQAKGPSVTSRGGSKFDSTLYKQCAMLTTDSIDISDTLIKGFIKTKVRNNQLDSIKLVYKPLFPKYIKKDSIIYRMTTEYNTVYEPYSQNIFYLGGSVGTNDIGVAANIKTKKDLIYGYRFGITYNGLKTHNIEFKIPIFKSKHKNKTNKK